MNKIKIMFLALFLAPFLFVCASCSEPIDYTKYNGSICIDKYVSEEVEYQAPVIDGKLVLPAKDVVVEKYYVVILYKGKEKTLEVPMDLYLKCFEGLPVEFEN